MVKKKSKLSEILKYVILLFLVWQSFLIIISLISPKVLLPRERFLYNDGPNDSNPSFFWNRANFDGSHYLMIGRFGYGNHQQAFFPFYPKIVKFFTPLFAGRDLLAAIAISNLSALISFFVFFKLILIDYSQKTAKRSLVSLLVFPASFFLGMVYTEGLFLLLVLSCFYAARKEKWLIAGILGAVASYTRIVGIFLFPALLFEWWEQNKVQSPVPSGTGQSAKPRTVWYRAKCKAPYRLVQGKVQSLLPILLTPLGLASYMRFLWLKYNDPLMFIHSQPFFGAERSGGKIVLLYQVFWRYLKMILTTKLDFLYYSVWMELLMAILFIILLILAHKAGIRKSYLIFSAFALIIPTLSGTFLSMSRFALVSFPCFIFLGMIKSNKIRNIINVVFILLAIISVVLFYRGYWIA